MGVHMNNKICSILALLIVNIFVISSCVSAITINKNTNPENKTDFQNSNYENFDCLIIGRASHTGFIKPGPGGGDVILHSFIPILSFDNISIGFGYKRAYTGDPWEYYPANGWIWTKGSNGIVEWSGDSLWGNLGKKSWSVQDPFIPGGWGIIDYQIKKGVKGFTGIRIGFSNCIFIGTASHVSIVTEF
jgi:hypothetical protein